MKDITIISSITTNNLYMNIILLVSLCLMILPLNTGNYPRAIAVLAGALKN